MKPSVDLDKRVYNLVKDNPQLINLTKAAKVSLEKRNLANHRAKVGLCLDISLSMRSLYQSGAIQRLVERVLALGLQFDDDGTIDVFLFGQHAHSFGEVGAHDYRDVVNRILRAYPLEPGTNYGTAMQRIRSHYARDGALGSIPIYIIFVTDGDAGDRPIAERQIREASRESIFWQFVAIGEQKKGLLAKLMSPSFRFLAELDNLPGRYIDNANFFSVPTPDAPTDNELYELLMQEYPAWLKQAASKGVLKG